MSSKTKNDIKSVGRDDIKAKEHRIKMREFIKTYQPVAFDVLNRSLQNDSVFHAYLFYGVEEALQKDMAIWLAQSILCESNCFIDETTCDEESAKLCEMIARLEYVDFIFLDGSRKKKLSKAEIDDLQETFSKTAVGKKNIKVYVIDHCENMTYEAANSLLKFLEEPSDGVYAILTTSQNEKVIPTIQSRCVPIPFKGFSEDVYKTLYLEEGLDEEDAFFLSCLKLDVEDGLKQVGSYAYITAKTMLKQSLGYTKMRQLLLVDYETSYKAKGSKEVDKQGEVMKDRDVDLDTLNAFFTFLIHYYQDVIVYKPSNTDWYDAAVRNAAQKMNAKTIAANKLGIVLEAKDRLNRNNDLDLLLFQTVFRLEGIE